VKSGTASVAYIPLPSERIRYGLSSVISHVSENEKFLNRKREQSKSIADKEELKIGINLFIKKITVLILNFFHIQIIKIINIIKKQKINKPILKKFNSIKNIF